ncbi:ATP-binding cassette domain-containing protein [Paenibacillus sp. KN14-4R]|uniref:ABC transporter ATP-binding protein n=1 Tax=Paenibacillus sp. KN14-4R TaxID=3445773 RepID=UPI003FA067D9
MSHNEYAFEIQGLTKRYGTQTALESVGFAVKKGSCFGLLGPNGAGKSTTMKILTGIIQADSGKVVVLGQEIQSESDLIRKQVGYVPQEITLYETLSAHQNLVFFGEMYGVRGAELKVRIKEVLEQVGLSDRANDAVKTFSGGMKRRINIAAALLHRPKLVILDEPTVGIDPQSRNHIFEMIRQLRDQGITIVYSTHYMEEVEALCDDIAIIDHGKVVIQGSLDELLHQYATRAIYVEIEGSEEPPKLTRTKNMIAQDRGWIVETDEVLPALQEMSQALIERGDIVKSLEILRPSLESVFLSLTGTSLRD